MIEFLRKIGILKTPPTPGVATECSRFKSDPAFMQYMDGMRYDLVQQLWGLQADDIDGFIELKRMQKALDGFEGFIDQAILNEKLKQQRATTA